jgi:phage regulator Rha-like protein
VETLVSQNAIPSRQHLGGALPYAFTEHGVLMLASVLKSEKAMQVSIRVIEIFVKMREMVSTHKDILLQLQKVENKLIEHDEDIQLIIDYLKQLVNEPQERTVIEGFIKKTK